MCRSVIQSKDDERDAEGPRQGKSLTSKDMPRHQRSRRRREFHVRIFDTLLYETRGGEALILECITQCAWHGIRGCWRSTYQFVSRSLSLQLLRRRNGSFERRVASSTCSLRWIRRAYAYLAANLHARRLIWKILGPITRPRLLTVIFGSFE